MAAMPPQLIPHAFTSANAAEMALKAAEAKRQRKLGCANPAHLALERDLNGSSPHARKVARLEAQIEAIDEAMEKAKTPADWRDLTNAKARLFEQWAHLAGIPKPGSRRPGREPVKRAASVPLDPAPAAQPNPAPEPPASTQ